MGNLTRGSPVPRRPLDKGFAGFVLGESCLNKGWRDGNIEGYVMGKALGKNKYCLLGAGGPLS